jgi:hypothetical protein
MPELSLRQAAAQAHASKSTLLRAIRSGLLSARLEDDGSYRIDPSELSRVYSADRFKLRATTQNGAGSGGGGAGDAVRAAALEAELRAVREWLEAEKRHAEAWRGQAEHWRGQAERLLLAAPIVTPPLTPPAPAPQRSWWKGWGQAS